jgi:hypothetical protein
LREIINIVTIEASHGNATVCGHINVRLLSQCLCLRGRQASETDRVVRTQLR